MTRFKDAWAVLRGRKVALLPRTAGFSLTTTSATTAGTSTFNYWPAPLAYWWDVTGG